MSRPLRPSRRGTGRGTAGAREVGLQDALYEADAWAVRRPVGVDVPAAHADDVRRRGRGDDVARRVPAGRGHHDDARLVERANEAGHRAPGPARLGIVAEGAEHDAHAERGTLPHEPAESTDDRRAGNTASVADLHQDDARIRSERRKPAHAPVSGGEQHRARPVLGEGTGIAVAKRDHARPRRVAARDHAAGGQIGMLDEADVEDGDCRVRRQPGESTGYACLFTPLSYSKNLIL